nr:uncharacterized protein LOC124217304 [Neodiprion pinetum]
MPYGLTGAPAHTTTPPYHPQANPVERVNRVLKTMIVTFLNNDHREWDRHLSDFRFACNTAHHTSLNTSPAFLNLGRVPESINSYRRSATDKIEIEPTPPKLWAEQITHIQLLRDWVTENLDDAFAKQARYYDPRRRDQAFTVNDLVLKRQHTLSSATQHAAAKLAPNFSGPYRIFRFLSPVVLELQQVDGNN